MTNLKKITAGIGASALLAGSMTILSAAPASADMERDRDFRVAGVDVDFSVEKDDRRFEVEVDLDDARPGTRWRVVLWHDGRRIHNRVHRADRDGEVEVEKKRRDTRGNDVFKVKVKKVGGPQQTRSIRMR